VKFLALISAAALVLLVACGEGDSAEDPAGAAQPSTTSKRPVKAEIRKPAKKEPAVVIPEGPPPKQLVINDLRVGDGATAKVGDQLTAEYIGFNYGDGYQFDLHAHRWGKGEPAEFELGAEEVIPGWDQGIEGMRVGGRRELIIPPDLAYGNVSPPPEVGPNETVVFVVELLGLEKSP
jgi:peptidylprolyl isomerase